MGSFSTVMAKMKNHAADTVKDALAIKITLLRAIEIVEASMTATHPSSLPLSSSPLHTDAQAEIV